MANEMKPKERSIWDKTLAAPRSKLETSVRNTGSAASKGGGVWVRYDDVLSLMIAVKRGRTNAKQ